MTSKIFIGVLVGVFCAVNMVLLLPGRTPACKCDCVANAATETSRMPHHSDQPHSPEQSNVTHVSHHAKQQPGTEQPDAAARARQLPQRFDAPQRHGPDARRRVCCPVGANPPPTLAAPTPPALIGPNVSRGERDCPMNFRLRQHQENLFFDAVFCWMRGSEWDDFRLNVNPRIKSNLSFVRDDFMDRLTDADSAIPSTSTVRSTVATFDQVTYESVAFAVADPVVPLLEAAVDALTGMVIDRSSSSLGLAERNLVYYHLGITPALIVRILSALKAPTSAGIVELPPVKDGYLWAIDWYHSKPGHFLETLGQFFGVHYEHYLKTGKNATMIFVNFTGADLQNYTEGQRSGAKEMYTLFDEYLRFFRQHYPVDCAFVPPNTGQVFRAPDVTFGFSHFDAFRPTAVRFFSEVIAPRVIEWCSADSKEGQPRCLGTPFLEWVKFDGPGGPRSTSEGAHRLRRRPGQLSVSRHTSIEQRLFAMTTADVIVGNWGGVGTLAAFMIGGHMPEKYLPWPRRSIDAIQVKTNKAKPPHCPPTRPPQRLVLMASAREHPAYVLEIFTWAFLYGLRDAETPGYRTPTWYAIGEEVGRYYFGGALVKMEWFGYDGEKWFPDAGSFDDAAFRLDDATMAALESATAPPMVAELLADDELFDYLLRTHRMMLMNRWIAQSWEPAPLPRSCVLPTTDAFCDADELRPFRLASSPDTPVFLASAALVGEPVFGDAPSARKMVVARRTTGTARYFVGGTSDALLQSTTRVSGWSWGPVGAPTQPVPSYADVVTTFITGSVSGVSGVIVQPGGAGTHGIAVPNSHPCLGILSELTIPGDPEHCGEIQKTVADTFRDVAIESTRAPKNRTIALWLMPHSESNGAGAAVQSVLSRLGHLALEGTLDSLAATTDDSVVAMIPARLTPHAIVAIKDLLKLFGITNVLVLNSATAFAWTGARVVVPPPFEGFRNMFTAQQFAATRWLAANRPMPTSDVGPADPRGMTVLGTLSYLDTEYAPLLARLAPAMAARNISHVIDAPPSAMSRLFRSGLTSLIVIYGDAMLYYASMWADSLRAEAGPVGWGESGRRARLNLLVICPPHFGDRTGTLAHEHRSRSYTNGRELNMPRGVHVKYITVTKADVEKSEPPHKTMSLEVYLKMGWLNFDGVPSEHEFGADPGEQSPAEIERIARAFRNATGRG